MNFSYDSANSAKMNEVMAKAENLQREMKLKKDVLIAGIIRKRKAFVPTGNDEIIAGDKVVIIAKSDDQKMNDLSDILR